jgi:glycosyltransferase involved in cell wall biosynthesis
MMGVLKRCARLIAHFAPGTVEPHVINFGPVPAGDPLLDGVLPRVSMHRLGIGPEGAALRRLLDHVRPDVVVLGEGPGGGMMSRTSRAARAAGIPQVCVENYYGPAQPERFVRYSPGVDEWFLLGLPESGRYGRITDRAVLAPPLLAPAPARLPDEVTLTILGYDPAVARLGLELLARLPRGSTARLLRAPGPHLRGGNGRVEELALPDEGALRGYLSATRMVACKSGFQQMVEALALGTPVVAREADGGVPEAWLEPALARWIRYFPPGGRGWSRPLAAAGVWVAERAELPWTAEVARIAHPAAYAAERLLALLRRYP